jgi:basic amino acid/polyamine antiporter, APA family
VKTAEGVQPDGDGASGGFVQGLSLFDATMLVAGSMIGSGVFIVSAAVAREVGSPFWLLTLWLISGLVTVGGALVYGELAAMMPRAGGQYVFLREAFGRLFAFLYGWTLLLVIQAGTIAAVAVAFGKFLGVLVPGLGEGTIVLDTGLPLGWPFARVSSAQLVGLAIVLVLTVVNLRGIHTGRRVQNVFTTAKIGSLLAIVALGGYALLWRPTTGNLTSGFWGLASGSGVAVGPGFLLVLGAALVGPLFAADAWNNVTFAAAEVRNPKRNLPLSLVLGTGIVILLYLGANVAYLAVLDFSAIGSAPEDRVATAMLARLLGPAGAVLLAAAILISTFGCNNGLILAGARVVYAMARDGLFLRGAGALNRAGVPGRALVWQGLIASLLALSGTYGKLLDFVIFANLLFYAATGAAVVVLRRVRADLPRPYRVIAYPWLPVAYVAATGAVALALLFNPGTRGSSLAGLLIVLSGLVAYAWMRGGRRDRA